MTETMTRRRHVHTQAYRTWCDRIDSGVFTKQQCQQYVFSVVRIALRERPMGRRTTLTETEATALMRRMQRRTEGVTLTEEHRQQGIDWLRRYGNSHLGLANCNIDVTSVTHFTFHGSAMEGMPLWRAHMPGQLHPYFDYWWSPWTRNNRASLPRYDCWWLP